MTISHLKQLEGAVNRLDAMAAKGACGLTAEYQLSLGIYRQSEALGKLFLEPSFRRLRTVQEVRLAKKGVIILRNLSLSWSLVSAANLYFQCHPICCALFFYSHDSFSIAT